ncbi:MAG: hypothetical protein FWC79_02155 [Oscillospiraceae bacterium]|nr:hypothetical protein [Oscillospiraceae bacterium]
MEESKEFFIKYRGAIIGGLIGILMLVLRLHLVVLWVAVIGFGIFARQLRTEQ